MLLQTEEAQMPKTEGKLHKAWEDTMIWAVIGLVCTFIAVGICIAGLNTVIRRYDQLEGPVGLAALLSGVSLFIAFWTTISRQDSRRPVFIIWIDLTSIIVLTILWISFPFLLRHAQ